MLIMGDLGCFDTAWKGWRLYRGDLISPEGWEITKGDVISSPILRQQLAAYKTELRRLRTAAEDLIPDQPLPEAWPDWILELRA